MTTPAADRVDLFTLVHKGIRRALFDTLLIIGRTDFSRDGDIASAREAVARCFDFLREHAEHEDRHIVPVLARLAPGFAGALEAEHVELEKAAIAIEALFPRVAAASASERPVMGREIFRRMTLLVADQLRHLEREEREGNATLWADKPDPEILALRAQIQADIPAARMAEWVELIAPVLTARERELLRLR
jgi:Hemerythrin HHE cation binding domain